MPGDRDLKYVLVIAGSDSCGGAGIQADMKTITSLGAHAMTAITAVTAQNSTGISGVHEIPAEFIAMQIESVMADVFPDSVKIGMLSSGRVIEKVAGVLGKYRLRNTVLDPVMKASTGLDLLDASSVALLKDSLIPLARVITPNLHEAGILAGCRVTNPGEMKFAARELKKMGPDVIITGGHLEGICTDILYDGKDIHYFQAKKIASENTHGTGCVFSSSLACFLAMGNSVVEAARLAHQFTRSAIARGYPCGKGSGAVSP